MGSDRKPGGAAVRDGDSMLSPAKVDRFPLTKFIVFVMAILFIFPGATSNVSPANFDNYYLKYCGQIVPHSPPLEAATTDSIKSLAGYFSASAGKSSITGVSFQPGKAFNTGIEGIIKLRGSLVLMDPNAMIPKNPGNSTKGRRLRTRNFHIRGPTIPLQRQGRTRFRLYGYWSQSSGKLCMVGSTLFHADGGKLRSYDALLNLNYPVKSSINDSLITGVLSSLDGSNSLNDQFESFSLLGLIKSVDYDYTLIEKERGGDSFSEFGDGGGNLSLEGMNQDVCTAFKWNSALELEYGSVCSNTSNNCNPLGSSVQFSPKIVLLTRIKCSSEGKLRLLIKFRNSTGFYYNVDYYGFDPSTTFIGEGKWDRKENRLCAVVCRFLNFSESLADTFVGDCSVRLCLRFPEALSIKSRSPLSGQIWNTKHIDDSGYFMKVGLQGSGKPLTGMKYEYSVRRRSPCAEPNSAKRKGKTYPDSTSRDMSFDMSVKDSKGHVARGYSSPFFVANQPYDFSLFGLRYFEVTNQTAGSVVSGSLQNISYTMSFMIPSMFKVGAGSVDDFSPNKTVEILAEGTYDREHGSLCMVGCRRLSEYSSFDCEIQVDIEFPPLKAKTSEKIKGSIRSTRSPKDPLYFEPLVVSSESAYLGQVQESIWRMDLEIVMVLISNSLTCIFIGLQLYHIKKNPDTVSLISMVMLLVLTLGLMIPLLLNFEALFVGKANHPPNYYILGASGGWLEVNEVIVRVVTMVAFLLQLRLLQLNWSARQQQQPNGTQNWASEKKVVYVLLPLFITGGLIAWFVSLWKNSSSSSSLIISRTPSLSLWEHSKSYAGLVLDGFLLPQILFNLFLDSREKAKALASSFYVGITMVRLLPHAYDLCRAQISAWYPDISYIYANHRMDFYSTAWDIIIPCCGMFLALFIFLQQRFGGRVLLPRRFRGSSADAYDKVPSIEL